MYRVAGSRSSRALISAAMAGLLDCINVTLFSPSVNAAALNSFDLTRCSPARILYFPETASAAPDPATNIIRTDILRTELNSLLLAPQSHYQRRQRECHKGGQSHGIGITRMLRENRLHVSDRAGQKHAALVSESGKKSAHRVGRQFREV